MEISGKVIQLLPMQSGAGRNGAEWRKQEFVIETTDQYPKKVCISMWGDKIDQFNIQPGEDITVSISVESREYNGKWYTNVQAWKVERMAATASPLDQPMPFPSAPDAPQTTMPEGLSNTSQVDDLPF